MSPERKAVFAGGAIIAFGALGYLANGLVYGTAEAREMLAALKDSALYFGSAMATSSGTTLALMLTLVGFVNRLDAQFGQHVYSRIRSIARYSALSLAGAVILLLVLTLPVQEFDEMPARWYPYLYAAVYALVVMLSGLLVGTVTLVFETVSLIVHTVRPEAEDG